MQKVWKIWSLLVCLSVLVALKITKVDISCIITCDSALIVRILSHVLESTTLRKKIMITRNIDSKLKAPLPLVHSHSVSYGRFKRRLVDFLSIEYWTLLLSLMLLVQIDKQADFISFRLFEFIWHNTLIILVYSDQMTSEARTHA